MKRISSVALAPLFVALGACSGGSGSKAHLPNGATGGSAEPGATIDGGVTDNSGDDGTSPPTPFEANLSGAEVAPAAVQTGATGKADLTLSPDGTTLAYTIAFQPGDFVPNSVNVHLGAVGENTGITHQLAPVGNQMTGQIPLSIDEQTAITSGQLYIDAPTNANPNGEIRGQIVAPGSEIFVANATAAQEVPSVMSAYSAHGAFIMTPDQGALVYHIVTTAPPNDVRLQRSIGGIDSSPVPHDIPLAQAVIGGGTTTLDGTVQLDAPLPDGSGDPQDVQNGRYYLNILTAQHSTGELRGQLVHPGESLFTGILSGANEVPPVVTAATGGVQVILSADRSTVRYEAVVNGVIPLAAEMASGAAGQVGSTMQLLSVSQNRALGTATVTSSDVAQLVAGTAYVNVKTASYASGELRAQLTAR